MLAEADRHYWKLLRDPWNWAFFVAYVLAFQFTFNTSPKIYAALQQMYGWPRMLAFLGAIAVFAYSLADRGAIAADLKWHKLRWRQTGYMIVAGIGLGTIIAWVYGMTHPSRPPLDTMIAVTSITVGPIAEELTFRAILLGGLLRLLERKRFGTPAAIFLTAAAFTAFHTITSIQRLVSILFTGCAYGWIRVLTGSVTAAAVAHAAYNITVVILYHVW